MANSKQAIKRAKQNAATYKLRHAQRSIARTAVKAVRASIDSGDATKAKEKLGWKPLISAREMCFEMVKEDFKIAKRKFQLSKE